MSRPRIRCAIYTRKSTEDGLDQEFNSLDAQREACAAYVVSQKNEGWKQVATRYDDGGISGGTLERPALQRLMADVDAGRIGMIVVYKIDRLTRSLADFAKLVERLETANCSFVSVTQAFNTSSSMGRLTLNVLLSFAQFEREVTAERIRDKIAASKKKGLWMGGVPPMGYDPDPDPQVRSLVIHPAEATTVRKLFGLYLDLDSLVAVERAAATLELRSKRHNFSTGRVQGGHRLTRGQIYWLLRNPIYAGKIRHKDKVWPGQHQAIIAEDLWDRVQAKLDAAGPGRRRRGTAGTTPASEIGSLLTGKFRDETGDRLTPTHTTRHGRRHRYYISNRLISGGPDPTGWRLPAPRFEAAVAWVIAAHLRQCARDHSIRSAADLDGMAEAAQRVIELVGRIEDQGVLIAVPLILSGRLEPGRIRIVLDPAALGDQINVAETDLHEDLTAIDMPLSIQRRGVGRKILAGERVAEVDRTLLLALARAHHWTAEVRDGQLLSRIARRESHSESYIRTRAQLAFLSPVIQQAILDGRQPTALTLESSVRKPIPLAWDDQERAYGFVRVAAEV